MLLRGPADKSGQLRQAFFSLAAAYHSVRNRGLAGKDGARRGLRHDGRAGEGREGGEGGFRAVEKAAEDEHAFVPEQSCGLADWGRLPRHCPDAAGGECGHGAAKPYTVIYR
jgi:hypothetical protein